MREEEEEEGRSTAVRTNERATRDQQQQQQVRSHDKAHLYRRVHQSLSRPSATAEEENPQQPPPE
jgi:hypothetical protein